MQSATKQYASYRDTYFRMMKVLEESTLPKAEIDFLSNAVLQATRRRFRSIANGLKSRMASRYHTLEACRGQSGGQRDEEHAVPLNLIHNRILNISGPCDGDLPSLSGDLKDLQALLEHHLLVVDVTPQQHATLKKTKMPKGWTWFGDVMARYKEGDGLAYYEAGACPHCAAR